MDGAALASLTEGAPSPASAGGMIAGLLAGLAAVITATPPLVRSLQKFIESLRRKPTCEAHPVKRPRRRPTKAGKTDAD